MRKPGEVQSLDNGHALVTMQRGAGCGAEQCPLGSPLLDEYGKAVFQVRAINTLGAGPGDSVLVEIQDRTALLIAFSLYLAPIITGFLTYFFIQLVTDHTALIAIAVIASLIGAGAFLQRLDRTIQPRYTIVDFADREAICAACPLTSRQKENQDSTSLS